MENNNALLSQLKNVHLPQEISIFPLAIGWYILIILIFGIIGSFIWWKLKNTRYKKQKIQIYALLSKIEKNQSDQMLSEVSILIKRVAIMKYPKEPVHTMFGEKWLKFLDKTSKTTNFTNGAGHYLLNIYQNQKIENPDQFFTCIRQWLRKVL